MVFESFIDTVLVIAYIAAVLIIGSTIISVLLWHPYFVGSVGVFCLIWYLNYRDRKYPPPKNGGKTG
jgi:Na+/H+-translocating membrane pyrophosphatase